MSLCGGVMGVGQRWKKIMTAGGTSMAWFSSQGWDDIFISMEGQSRMVWGGWPMAVVWIQYFGFSSRWEVTGQSVVGRWGGDNELALATSKGSVTRRDGVTTSIGGEAEPGKKKGGETLVELTQILLDWKMKKIHMVDLAATNRRWIFKAMLS
jgi:hypothetical protein